MIGRIEKLPGEPIVVIALVPPIDNVHDPQRAGEEFLRIMGNDPGRSCRIIDFSRTRPNVADVMMGLGGDPVLARPEVLNIFVGSDAMVQFAAEDAGQEQYNGNRIIAFETMSEALDAARALLE